MVTFIRSNMDQPDYPFQPLRWTGFSDNFSVAFQKWRRVGRRIRPTFLRGIQTFNDISVWRTTGRNSPRSVNVWHASNNGWKLNGNLFEYFAKKIPRKSVNRLVWYSQIFPFSSHCSSTSSSELFSSSSLLFMVNLLVILRWLITSVSISTEMSTLRTTDRIFSIGSFLDTWCTSSTTYTNYLSNLCRWFWSSNGESISSVFKREADKLG